MGGMWLKKKARKKRIKVVKHWYLPRYRLKPGHKRAPSFSEFCHFLVLFLLHCKVMAGFQSLEVAKLGNRHEKLSILHTFLNLSLRLTILATYHPDTKLPRDSLVLVSNIPQVNEVQPPWQSERVSKLANNAHWRPITTNCNLCRQR